MRSLCLRPAPLALAACLALNVLAAQAQAPAAASAPAPGTAATAALPVQIAAQPLAQALNDLARQARLELVVQPALVQGRQAPAVQGTFTARQALDRLLAGTGLVAVIEGSLVTVQRDPAAGASGAAAAGVALAEVRVQAQAERGPLTEHTGSYTTAQSGTATPLGLSLRETPQSVSVITRQRMEDQGLTQLADVAAQTAGLVVSQAGNAGSDSSPIYSPGLRWTPTWWTACASSTPTTPLSSRPTTWPCSTGWKWCGAPRA